MTIFISKLSADISVCVEYLNEWKEGREKWSKVLPRSG